MTEPSKNKRVLSWLILSAAMVFLFVGSLKSHKVYDKETKAVGVRSFQHIDEIHMVIDATFGGVIAVDGQLLSTYDRSIKGGKRPCLT